MRRPPLGLSLPLGAAGCLAGHAAGYAVVGMSRQDARIHGYLAYTPQFLGICFALVAVTLALRLGGRLRGRPAIWPFALVPLVAFLAQETIERLVAGLPLHSMLEPAVYVGLAAQVPIIALSYVLAHALLRVADEAVCALTVHRLPALQLGASIVEATSSAPIGRRLAFDQLGRAPPR